MKKKNTKASKSRLCLAIKPMYDKEFSKSLWTYDLIKEFNKALREFGKRFPNVKFIIMKPSLWKSPGNTNLSTFPYSVIYKLQKKPVSSLLKDSIAIMRNDLSLPVSLKTKSLNKINRKLKGKKKGYVAFYIIGYMEDFITKSFLENLNESSKKYSKADFVVGFTGKICRVGDLAHNYADCGFATLNGRCGVVGAYHEPHVAILHELCHMFGAKHSENKRSIMFPKQTGNKYSFDKKTRRAITLTLKNIREKRKNAAK